MASSKKKITKKEVYIRAAAFERSEAFAECVEQLYRGLKDFPGHKGKPRRWAIGVALQIHCQRGSKGSLEYMENGGDVWRWRHGRGPEAIPRLYMPEVLRIRPETIRNNYKIWLHYRNSAQFDSMRGCRPVDFIAYERDL